MQAGKNAAASAKETAANAAASAKSGMDKTKATVQEKAERMTARDPMQKEMATEKKETKKTEAELNKQEAHEHNAAARQMASTGGTAGTYTHSATGATGHPTGGHQMSAMPGHGTGQTTEGYVAEGAAGSKPTGINTGTGQTTAHNTRAGGGTNTGGFGTGDTYT
ncbi:hypothetical protein L1049_021608 [Liquidambar formosana]|uniref:Uncharacterized protein n=1 Tax=Liquidambar formosana TaxID=63359 RepID=A0AAP0R1P9_LIQFO